jgi:pyruvate/2-oxoglutarate dehydrogenase complex dihydrolipoamide acyltransferase (E2) component
MKAVVVVLKAMPRFNASLDGSGENLVLKRYFHLGVAVDTPNGRVGACTAQLCGCSRGFRGFRRPL